jgi:hypothetical protein
LSRKHRRSRRSPRTQRFVTLRACFVAAARQIDYI